jgi:DNA polymerase III delta subunit
MIYLFSGDDVKNKLGTYEKLLAKAPKGSEIFRLAKNDFNPAQLEGFYSGAGLFSKHSVVSLSDFLSEDETEDFILNHLDQFASSANWFVLVEGKLNKPILDVFKKAKAEINIFEAPKTASEKFNSFGLANSFGVRDKLNLWIQFREAMANGVALEELAGILFWKAKDMLIKKSFGKFTEEELKNFVQKISYLLPESRQKGKDAEAAFEQFLLEAF